MKILAIETSCDETSVAILKCTGELENLSFNVLSHALNSQIDIHQQYGGVFPMMAKREHSRNLIPLLQSTLVSADLLSNSIELLSRFDNDNTDMLEKVETILEREPELLKQFLELIPKIEIPKIDAIAVTVGPGLEPALWVGVNFAKALSFVWDKPLIPVNHMEGHIFSVLVKNRKNVQNNELRIMNYEYPVPPSPFSFPPSVFSFPIISLLISGGHTQLVLVRDWGEYEIVGETRDDAVGEAFDKVARMLGLPYPGGPEISRLAEEARNSQKSEVRSLKTKLPRPMINTDDFDFSFSGLKTAVLYKIKDRVISEEEKIEIAREFEDAVTEVLEKKTKNAIIKYGASGLIVGGGVIANKYIRENLTELCKELDVAIYLPTSDVTGDNAIMIGAAGYIKTKIKYQKSKIKMANEEDSNQKIQNNDLKAEGNLRLG